MSPPLYELEDRMLYDGAAADEIEDVINQNTQQVVDIDNSDNDNPAINNDIEFSYYSGDAEPDSIVESVNAFLQEDETEENNNTYTETKTISYAGDENDFNDDLVGPLNLSVSAYEEPQKEIVLIDSSVKDVDDIISALESDKEVVIFRHEGDDNSAFEDLLNDNDRIVYLDKNDNPVDNIAKILQNGSEDGEYDAVHIISHGGDGFLYLNGNIVDSDALSENSDTFAAWGNALSENGDIMIYGCNVAASETGEEFVNSLADLTGADIAASEDSTGITGNWDMEYTVGNIETESITVEDYSYRLYTHIVTTLDDEEDGNYTAGDYSLGIESN
jgi:hypothetical protein